MSILMNPLLRLMETSKFHYLLASLTLMIVSYPFIEGRGFAEHLFLFINLAIFFSSLYMFDHSRRLRLFAYINGGIMLLFGVLSSFMPVLPQVLELIFAVSTLSFFIFLAMAIIADFLHTTEVTVDTISGAACVYLLIGVIWSLAYALVEHIDPGSFHFTAPKKAIHLTNTSSFSYFSFVTLTTVGFGDIIPISKGAKLLVIIEAILGQFYIAIFLARIIASYQGKKKSLPPSKGNT